MYSCHDCTYLDKSRKQASKEANGYRYGCNLYDNEKYICGWLLRENDLNFLGCSNWIEKGVEKQISF